MNDRSSGDIAASAGQSEIENPSIVTDRRISRRRGPCASRSVLKFGKEKE
ncbi:hypothetical protein IHE45_05G060100 [Dioscorea alata]|uniref:Uncharacterized protein n=1 Tax=Dioscorea alata TaxID=55571 RepID=A0ACB7W205_DIOAL|nr:hypothetical protein IHE45_05G060100 [Dioscorea alata]